MLKSLKVTAVALASVGLFVPQSARAGGSAPTPSAPASVSELQVKTPDVKLVNGKLVGRVVNGSGQPIATTLTVQKNGQTIASTTTAADGSYTVGGLDAGVYTIVTSVGATSVRTWSNAAPPKSMDSLLLVDGPVVRGNIMGSPVVLAAVVTGVIIGTIAIVEAADDDDPVVSP